MNICFIVNTRAYSAENRLMIKVAGLLAQKKHFNVSINKCDKNTDLILGNSIGNTKSILQFLRRNTNAKLVLYNWDLYPWTQNQYDFKKYKLLVDAAEIVLCPSQSVIERTGEFFKAESKCRVLKSYVEFFDFDMSQLPKNDIIFHPLRKYDDPQYGWLNRACRQLHIPFVRSEHKLSEADYRNAIYHSRIIVNEYFESSTGGLSLHEGYAFGGAILVSDSEYQGASDYFGEKVNYFRTGSFSNFKYKLEELWVENEFRGRRLDIGFMAEYSIEKFIFSLAEILKEIHHNPKNNHLVDRRSNFFNY